MNKAAPKSAARQSHSSPSDRAVATCSSSSAACTNRPATEARRDARSNGAIGSWKSAGSVRLSFRTGLLRSATAEKEASASGGSGFRGLCFVTRCRIYRVETVIRAAAGRRQGSWHGIADDKHPILSSTLHMFGAIQNPSVCRPGGFASSPDRGIISVFRPFEKKLEQFKSKPPSVATMVVESIQGVAHRRPGGDRSRAARGSG